MTRPIVSFLLGSGFSIPEGLPGVKQINERLSKINESEILIDTSQHAIFLNGKHNPNRWSRQDERFFLQEFLEFYNLEILKAGETFHYETFYDFYAGYLNNGENEKAINDFYQRFNAKHFGGSDDHRDCYNRIADFNRTFNQLLASLLHKPRYFEDVGLVNYPNYEPFLGFLGELLNTSDLKVHTLNHDLFFDFLGRNHDKLWQHFSDGYQLEGSPFYGTLSHDFLHEGEKVHKSYYVKLERFINKYDKSLAYFKLRGSIFNTIVYTAEPRKELIRLKDNYGINQFFMEVLDETTKEYRLAHLWDEVAPDFLSGTTNKMRYYTGDSYYKNLFEHFEKNLSNSELLVVVGYGFQDAGINEYLEKYFLERGKKMIVISPSKPKTDLIDKYNAVHIPKGVTDIDFEEYLGFIPENLRAKAGAAAPEELKS